MTVERITSKALKSIVDGKITRSVACVIKLYSTHCAYCHALSHHYWEIAEENKDIYFFAFNIDDDEENLSKILGKEINGVPTIVLVKKPRRQGRRGHMKVLKDPETPHGKTWYYPDDIREFIKRYTKQ